ncbi:protein of unknown function [Lactobacillus delbrueckii subsp. delbrueckii]|uniref:Uncharacterized protein n=1 Tax=Lactobacillus delbrueckii subsp. delbrueckii TaxID=83684 RepID=A0AAU9R292_9LACO|nr:protein of unknown function [Lactobacillus delbrueckii subsp. delbrueckii]
MLQGIQQGTAVCTFGARLIPRTLIVSVLFFGVFGRIFSSRLFIPPNA